MLTFDHASGTLSATDRIVVANVPPGGNWRDLPEDFPSERVKKIRAGALRGEGSRSTYYGRLAWDTPAYTISTYITRPGNGCFIHPQADRLITVREAARLQSFPDWIQFQGTMRQRSMQVGNAVPPLMAYQLGRTIEAGTVVDLFSGAGGLGMGMEWSGHNIVLSVDNNSDALKTLQSYKKDSHVTANLDLSSDSGFSAAMDAARSALRGRKLGLLTGGPPCQGFSTAGPCRVDDPRNLLVRRFLDAVVQLDPHDVIFENVPALQWRGRAFLDEIKERLTLLGYVVEMRILHAEAYNVPQLRRRLVVRATKSPSVSWPAPIRSLRKPFFAAEQPGPLIDDLSGPTVREAIGDLPSDAALSLDEGVSPRKHASDFGLWAQGRLSVDELMLVSAAAPVR